MGDRKNWIVQMTRAVSRIILSPFFSLKIESAENVPRSEGVVLLPKHQRWQDIPLIGLASPRPLYYVAKFELFKNPVSRWFLESMGGISLNRQNPLESRDSLKRLIAFLKKGEGVVIFPEGTYYRDMMGSGRPGMIRLILSSLSLPFIPVGINYSQRGWRTRVRIKFGKAIDRDGTLSSDEFLSLMMKEIATLSGLD